MRTDTEMASQRAARRASSFDMAMRILAPPQRAAMFDIYGFCRAVDDVADGDMAPQQKCAALERWREEVDACCAGAAPAHLRSLACHIKAYGLAREDFHAVIDGMLMDAQASPICAPPAATLDLYCDRVASAVGRLSVRVFGMPPGDGILLAHHLGRALQLTNILRDIDEDAAVGRAYLPRELLLDAGIGPITCSWGARAIAAHPSLPAACTGLAAQACGHYGEAHAILRRQSAACARAPRLMGAVYQALLARLVARGWDHPRAAVRVGNIERIGILLRHAFV
ncbi:presqualene diphosphate synthase HpnD [Massilia sp. LXY-6]|uniref:presqualene diphosphate synthase HpnD n=1 Tax=Massilia sp. LXY-6 TaxID=3379823 RepID=UPI003EE012CC